MTQRSNQPPMDGPGERPSASDAVPDVVPGACDAPAVPIGPWGRSDILVLAVVRHCLGKSSYEVDECADWMVEYWSQWNEGLRALVRSEINEWLAGDDRDREHGHEPPLLGTDRDRAAWERVRALWARP